jgi:phosphatidylethanolamine-binding protein (PEBP) family uncharacterized protein
VRPAFLLSALTVLVACGSDSADPIDAADTDGTPSDGSVDAPADASGDGPAIDAPAAFTLTSTVITEGGVIPDMYSCQGTNVSPPLTWTGGPAAPGYALVFTDVTTSPGFLHSIIWDIPGGTVALPENVQKVYMPPVPAGSKQPLGYNNTTRGYLGPCPNSMHSYAYALHAVDVYPLPSLSMTSARDVVEDAILAHSTARATLTATFTP